MSYYKQWNNVLYWMCTLCTDAIYFWTFMFVVWRIENGDITKRKTENDTNYDTMKLKRFKPTSMKRDLVSTFHIDLDRAPDASTQTHTQTQALKHFVYSLHHRSKWNFMFSIALISTMRWQSYHETSTDTTPSALVTGEMHTFNTL